MSAAPTQTSLRLGTWEDTERFLGTTFPAIAGADAVEAGAIRRRLEVLEWDSPLHTDAALAVKHGHPKIVAPATMTEIFAMPPYWKPGDLPLYEKGVAMLPPLYLDQIPAPGERMVATGWSLRNYRYLHVGERVSATSTFVRMDRKQTRLGDGAFLTLRTDFRDEEGETVATRELTVFRF